MRQLGWMNVTGKGREKDISKGINLYKIVLAKGNKRVLFDLGNAYLSKDNYTKAREYYKKGADSGDSNCMNVLGTMNLWGRGGGGKLFKSA